LQLDAEIINADSRQFYRMLDIGTAKPNSIERRSVPHHFIDIRNPDEYYSAGEFEAECISFLTDYFKRKSTAILVGGSGLYINAVIRGFDEITKPKPEIREKWNQVFVENGLKALQVALKQLDPAYSSIVDLRNPQRLIRALEVIESSGKPFSEQLTRPSKKRLFNTKAFFLNPPRDLLYNRINERVDQMMHDGLLEEVQSLIPYKTENALQTLGYSELFQFLNGEISLESATEKIKQHSRNYAKRQVTWFKKQPEFMEITHNYFKKIYKQLSASDFV
jgi:tRNA dimethylallyltransferase